MVTVKNSGNPRDDCLAIYGKTPSRYRRTSSSEGCVYSSGGGLQDPLLNSNAESSGLNARTASQFASRLMPACELKEFGSVYGRTTDPGLISGLRPMSSVATGTPADSH